MERAEWKKTIWSLLSIEELQLSEVQELRFIVAVPIPPPEGCPFQGQSTYLSNLLAMYCPADYSSPFFGTQ
jgi:hypothetical protein